MSETNKTTKDKIDEKSKRFGQYDLTQTEILEEIRKTDKMLAKFYRVLKELRDYKDKSNSSGLNLALDSTSDIEIPGEEE